MDPYAMSFSIKFALQVRLQGNLSSFMSLMPSELGSRRVCARPNRGYGLKIGLDLYLSGDPTDGVEIMHANPYFLVRVSRR